MPTEHFRIAAGDWIAAEDAGDVLAVVHSHPDAGPHASAEDLQGCQKTGLPWIIISWRGGDYTVTTPDDSPPLLNRPFIHGSWDCYGLVRDWYMQERGIELPDFPREDNWWTWGKPVCTALCGGRVLFSRQRAAGRRCDPHAVQSGRNQPRRHLRATEKCCTTCMAS